MSDDELKQKIEILKSMLGETPDLNMRVANRVFKEKHGYEKGVSPTIFGQVKRELSGAEPTEVKEDKKKIEKPVEIKKEDEISTDSNTVSQKENPVELEIKSQEVKEAPVVEVEAEPIPEVDVSLKVFIPSAEEVHLSGSFNKWKVESYPLERSMGHWVFEGKLPIGKHFYKFVVNKKEWFLDFDEKLYVDDTGVSHVLEVKE